MPPVRRRSSWCGVAEALVDGHATEPGATSIAEVECGDRVANRAAPNTAMVVAAGICECAVNTNTSSTTAVPTG
jgi:hypothetical protein